MTADNISGKSKVFGVIGNPISHTFSPAIHNTIAKNAGHDLVYVPFHVLEDNVGKAINGAHSLGISGLNVTIPHKREVMKHLISFDSMSEQIGAVNTLKYTPEGYIGYNTDITGIRHTFRNNGVSLKGKTAVILGAGGSAAACAAAVCIEGASKLYILNRTMKNAEYIAENIKKYYNISVEVLHYDEYKRISDMYTVLQTTSLGFSNDISKSPIEDKTFFEMAEFYLDIIYTPWETLFLKQARSAGKKTINGFDMLIYQAVASYEIWLDIKLPDELTKRIKEELECRIQVKMA